MKVKFPILFCVYYLCAFTIVVFNAVFAQEITKNELVTAYKKNFASMRSWDVSYATGHISDWDGWKPKPTHQQQLRWRKSGDVERRDRSEYIGDVSVRSGGAEHGNGAEETVVRMPIRSSADYTDGTKWWRLYGDPSKAEGIDLIDQKGLHAEVSPITRSSILSVFPYYNFCFSLFIDEYQQEYLLSQILEEFQTEIVDRKQGENGVIITTRSYLSSAKENPKHFIQISFDSSVGYQPRQLVFPLNTKTIEENVPYRYVVNDFVEYYKSKDGAFFPVKIKSGATDDINKLDDLRISGKVAVSDITLNQPVDVPAIEPEFPPGLVVIIEESGKTTSYIWGDDGKPLKVLTSADYKVAEEVRRQAREPGLPPREGLSTMRIVLIIAGIALLFIAFALRMLRRL